MVHALYLGDNKKLVITVEDANGHLPAREFIALLSSLNVSIELAAILARTSNIRSGSRDVGGEELFLSIRVARTRYGSPLEFSIDLYPLFDFIGSGGWIGFIAALPKVLGQAATTWKTFEEAADARRKRKLATADVRQLQENYAETEEVESRRADAANWASLESSKLDAVLMPLIEAIVEGVNQDRAAGGSMSPLQARAVGRRFIEINESELTTASETLKDRRVRIEFG